MLSNDNIRRINNQIADEIRTAGSSFSSNDDKAAALDRAEKLKQLLNPNPSADQIVEQLAAALSSQTTTHFQTTTPSSPLADAIRAFCR